MPQGWPGRAAGRVDRRSGGGAARLRPGYDEGAEDLSSAPSGVA